MRRPAKRISQKLSPDSKRLADLAQAFTMSSSRLEQRYWEHQLDAHLARLLKSGNQHTLDDTMNHLFKVDLDAYDALMEAVEAGSESAVLEEQGRQALLIAMPILAWTRFAIASSPVPADTLASLCVQLQAHVLADDVRLAMAPMLYSIDQLPRTHADIHAMLNDMAQAAQEGKPLSAPAKPPETAPFLADSRYLLAAVTAPLGQALFRWQAPGGNTSPAAEKLAVLRAWQAQAAPHIARLLPGCNIELMLPEAYYMACREADKQIRPASVRAADYYLTTTLNLKSADLHASIGGFGEDSATAQIDEYRIGFSLGQNPDVVYGIVWPLYGAEDSDQIITSQDGEMTLVHAVGAEPGPATPLEEILSSLRESGIVNIKVHDEYFAMEFCDDCGAPLYADRNGELVHAEMPEDAPITSGHLH
ncbi:DUF2863 family protein [Oxalobacteraceae bacterium CAVE-383]|nr:DUF2863 family protein [Oxalobacteraceae bacterium CAVE-383]